MSTLKILIMAGRVKLRFFQNFPPISIYNDHNCNILVKNQPPFLLRPPFLEKQQEQNCRERNIFQGKTKHKVDGLVQYYCTKRNCFDFI